MGEETIEDPVWDAMVNSWPLTRRGTKVGMCRWWAIFRSLRVLLTCRSSKLIMLLWICMNEAWIKPGYVAKHAYASAAVVGIAAVVASNRTARSAPDQVGKLRKACSNALHLCCLFMADPFNEVGTHTLCNGCRAVESWH